MGSPVHFSCQGSNLECAADLSSSVKSREPQIKWFSQIFHCQIVLCHFFFDHFVHQVRKNAPTTRSWIDTSSKFSNSSQKAAAPPNSQARLTRSMAAQSASVIPTQMKTARPALASFYDSLSDVQKAKFNTLGPPRVELRPDFGGSTRHLFNRHRTLKACLLSAC
jgi:LTXXQ motif family protein